VSKTVELARIECDGFHVTVIATETVKYGTKGIEILNGPENDYIALVPYAVAATWSRSRKIASLTIIKEMCEEVHNRTN
jgi:hypothetical protein